MGETDKQTIYSELIGTQSKLMNYTFYKMQ